MNYEAIVERLVDLNSDDFNDWESEFIHDLWYNRNFNDLSDRQKQKILEINNKYGKIS